jgi:hypothetical protein
LAGLFCAGGGTGGRGLCHSSIGERMLRMDRRLGCRFLGGLGGSLGDLGVLLCAQRQDAHRLGAAPILRSGHLLIARAFVVIDQERRDPAEPTSERDPDLTADIARRHALNLSPSTVGQASISRTPWPAEPTL